MKSPPVCLSVAGLDPSGGAGLLADVRTFAAHGCFAAGAVTSVTFQNTQGVFGSVPQEGDSVRAQMEPVFDDYEVAAAKTGMLPTRDVISEVAAVFSERPLEKLVVDPVVRSTSGYDLIDGAALEALIAELLPLAVIVTPNIAEAERISGIEISSISDAESAARKIRELGAANVLIKGGHRVEGSGGSALDLLLIGTELTVLSAPYIETTSTHGTGCVLSAAIAANLAEGHFLPESVARAKDFVHEAIRTSPGVGKGHSPINIEGPEIPS